MDLVEKILNDLLEETINMSLEEFDELYSKTVIDDSFDIIIPNVCDVVEPVINTLQPTYNGERFSPIDFIEDKNPKMVNPIIPKEESFSTKYNSDLPIAA